jgi:hypothetical protein
MEILKIKEKIKMKITKEELENAGWDLNGYEENYEFDIRENNDGDRYAMVSSVDSEDRRVYLGDSEG